MRWLGIWGCLALAAAPAQAQAHDIYTGLLTKDGMLPCCGGEGAGANRDCWRTVYRERGDAFEFRTKKGDWVAIPVDRIQFTPIPGDTSLDSHTAHLCYRDDAQTIENYHEHGNGGIERLRKTISGAEIVVYCAIIPPGGT